MEISQERQEQLIQIALRSVQKKLTRKQCFLKGFDSGVKAAIAEINQTDFTILPSRRDQMRRVVWNQASIGGAAPNGSSEETFRLGFGLGWKSVQEEFAKQNKA